jgi:hypothetical protein
MLPNALVEEVRRRGNEAPNKEEIEQVSEHDMSHDVSRDHPLRKYFLEAVHQALSSAKPTRDLEDVEDYLSGLLVRFASHESLYAIRNAEGAPVRSVAELLMEGDIRYHAASFDREREVHRHIGDLLLFTSGLFPELLADWRRRADDALLDPIRQGQESYYVVSTFDHDPYAGEAYTFLKLSEHFEAFRYGLHQLRGSFGFA